jgi:hypothetical protein
LNKNFIINFNKNNNVDNYNKIFIEYFNHLPKCRNCDLPIYYYDSTFRLNKLKILELKNKSCLTFKKLDKIYFLSICEKCLTEKFPEYQTKNKSRIFNQMNYITEYAFNIPEDIALNWMKDKYAITEINLINKYGEILGKEKWQNYCIKQKLTNTFDYKKDKYDWDKNKFNEYNKSRSITLENLINIKKSKIIKF